jgi:hypothetical protein
MMAIASKYPEQLDRVRRWYQRFQEISEGKLLDKPSDFYQDEVYAYFMNCYHLKDWIKYDPSTLSLAAKEENFIRNDPHMTLCADICNSSKHLKLSNPRSYENPQFGKREYKLEFGTQPTTIAIEYTIDTASGPIDAFDLATNCLHAWEAFLRQHGICT